MRFYVVGIVVLAAVLAAAPRAEEQGPTPETAVLQVIYTDDAGRISVRAKGVPLGEVLKEVSKQGGFDLRVMEPDSLADPVSVELEEVTVSSALRRLLAVHSKAMLFAPDAAGSGETRMTHLVVLSRRPEPGDEPSPSSGVATIRRGAGDDPAGASAATTGDDEGATELIGRAVSERDWDTALFIADSLSAADLLAARQEAAMALLEGLDPNDPHGLLQTAEVLEKLAPERAAREYIALLGLVRDGAGSRASEHAIVLALGTLSVNEAVAPLIDTFNGAHADADTRSVAAQSLASMSEPAADQFLLDVSRDPSLDRREPAVMAIGLRGSPEAKRALTDHIDRGVVSTEGAPRVDDLLGN